MRTHTAIRPARAALSRVLVLVTAVVTMAACGADEVAAPTPVPPAGPELPPPSLSALDGSWRALYWIAETASGTVFDVITEGGSIVFQVDGHDVTGNMHVPENVTNGAPTSVSMDGTVQMRGDTVTFNQTFDTFVQHADWKHVEGEVFDSLILVDYNVEGTRFTVVLVRNW